MSINGYPELKVLSEYFAFWFFLAGLVVQKSIFMYRGFIHSLPNQYPVNRPIQPAPVASLLHLLIAAAPGHQILLRSSRLIVSFISSAGMSRLKFSGIEK